MFSKARHPSGRFRKTTDITLAIFLQNSTVYFTPDFVPDPRFHLSDLYLAACSFQKAAFRLPSMFARTPKVDDYSLSSHSAHKSDVLASYWIAPSVVPLSLKVLTPSFLDSEVVNFSGMSCRAQHLADRSCVSATYIMPGNWQASVYIFLCQNK